jgi:uncharacterized RmlC-like cupin family protein
MCRLQVTLGIVSALLLGAGIATAATTDDLSSTHAVAIHVDVQPASEAFAGSGTLVRGPQSCVLVFLADSGEIYTLDDTGDFWFGDRVYVTGRVNDASMACFPVTIPAIENNTIQPYFEGAGTLQRGPQSCLFIFVADNGEVFTLDDTGDFWFGDRVYVTGRVDTESWDCFPVMIPAIEENTIQPYFEGAGTLVRGPQSCLLVFLADGGEIYTLDDTGDFWFGDRVYVTGRVNTASWDCFPVMVPAIEENSIETEAGGSTITLSAPRVN